MKEFTFGHKKVLIAFDIVGKKAGLFIWDVSNKQKKLALELLGWDEKVKLCDVVLWFDNLKGTEGIQDHLQAIKIFLLNKDK